MTNDQSPDNPAAFLIALMRVSFVAFLRKAWPAISGGDDLLLSWHIDAIANQLDRIATGDLRRLIAALPPRYGKSKIISVIWVAWMLGRDPTRSFVCVSYSNELSAKLARDCLAIMREPWYTELFPKTIISHKRSASWDFDTTEGGGRLATSVTGTLTGRGGDIIILDDVIKPEDANSEALRSSVNNWFQSTLASRLNDKATGAIILVMQRLHEDDLAGVLIRTGGWYLLKLPAIATEDETIPLTRGQVHFRRVGDVLHPEREPQAVLDFQKATMGSAAFSAQYQQEPVPATGNVIKGEWFGRFDPAKISLSGGKIIQSWDTASKDKPHNDYSACITALVRGRDIWILDVHRSRMQIPVLKAKAIALAREHAAHVLLIEDQASGTQLIQTLQSENPRGVPTPITCRPESDKVSRALGAAALIESRRVHLPSDAPWIADFLSEVLGFPNGRFDDQVDALAQLLSWVRSKDAYFNLPRFMPVLINCDDDFPDGDSDPGDNRFGPVGPSYFFS